MLKAARTPLSKEEIQKMRQVCQLAAKLLDYLEVHIKAGITTAEIDLLAEDFTKTHSAQSAPLGYHGFPKSICTSVNSIVCHGVPDQSVLKDGDIVNVDVTPFLNGFYGDSSRTYFVGDSHSAQTRKLVEAAHQAMFKGIEAITPNGTTGDIGFEIEKFVKRQGFSVVREIGGHGIGRSFHEDPFVPSFGKKGRGDRLIPWTCLTVEPMVNEGVSEVREIAIPGSTIKFYETEDKKLSAQFEHTVLITDSGFEILTLI
jgi:methionyl aminopeptidase